MILGLEIGMLIFGFIGLVTGKLKLSAGNEVEGAPARLLGLVAILPLPLALVTGFCIGLSMGPRVHDMQGTFLVIELGLVGICALIVFGGGAMVAGSQRVERDSRRRRFDVRDDFEEEPRRRRRRDEPDDDWEAPPPRDRGASRGGQTDVAIKADPREAIAPPPPAVAPSTPSDTIECPGCKWRLRITPQLIGKQIRCQNCKQVFRAPAPR